MSSAIHRKLKVLPGGKIELSSPQLSSGQSVDVFVVVSDSDRSDRPSALDILGKAPGHRLFQSAEEVDTYLQDERDAWNH